MTWSIIVASTPARASATCAGSSTRSSNWWPDNLATVRAYAANRALPVIVPAARESAEVCQLPGDRGSASRSTARPVEVDRTMSIPRVRGCRFRASWSRTRAASGYAGL